MAYTRTKYKSQVLDAYFPGDKLPFVKGAPCPYPDGPPAEKTGINNIVLSVNSLANIGYIAAAGTGANFNGFKYPYLGYAGPSFSESLSVSTDSIPCIYVNGYDRFELIYRVNLISVGTVKSTVTFSVNLPTVGAFELDKVNTTGTGGGENIGTGQKNRYVTGALPAGLPSWPGVMTSDLTITLDRAAVRGGTVSVADNYWDGVQFFHLRFYQSCP